MTGRFLQYTDDLLHRPEVARLRRRQNHHFQEDRLTHALRTARWSFWLARLFRADVRVATRAALLHDWYFEEREEHENRVGANVHHYRIAVANARGIGEQPTVLHAIATHMWPYGRQRPRTREAWIVWSADNIVWLMDGLRSAAACIKRAVRRFLYGPSYHVGAGHAS